MSTQFFCDTNSELWYTEFEKLGLIGIKMPYILEEKEYYYDFGKETDFDFFYNKVASGILPKTAALNEYNYTEYFEPEFQKGNDIFYISFSSKLSGTFDSMNKAATALLKKYPERKFTWFDTKSISMGCGIQVLYAMRLKNSGASDEEVLAFLKDFTTKVSTYLTVDDLFHLQKGGRISGVAATFGTMLNLKPILKVSEEGTLVPVDKVKGMKKAFTYIVDKMKENIIDIDKYDVWIMHANTLARAEELKQKMIAEISPNLNVNIQMVGPVIGSHCGPGCLGIIFPSKKK